MPLSLPSPTVSHTADPDDSESVITIDPRPDDGTFMAKQNKAFRAAFLSTMKDPQTEGALTSYLFHDLSPETTRNKFNGIKYDVTNILSGGKAWDRRTAENAQAHADGFGENDTNVISYSLGNGLPAGQKNLISYLPNDIRFFSYGGGDDNAFNAHEGQIISEVAFNSDKKVVSFGAIDIFPRYARNLAHLVAKNYDVRSQGVRGDAMRNGRLAIEKGEGTPVLMIFGGLFENVAIDANNPDAETNVAIAWAKINIQHGLGSIVIKTFDGEQSPQIQEKKYAPTRNFEAFELSFFARAMEQSIIKNPGYDIFAHWRLATEYDSNTKAVKLIAECKKSHSLITDEGIIDFKEGDRRTPTLSHKWDTAVHMRAANRAGFSPLCVFNQPGNPNPLMVMVADRDPDADILAQVPFSRQP